MRYRVPVARLTGGLIALCLGLGLIAAQAESPMGNRDKADPELAARFIAETSQQAFQLLSDKTQTEAQKTDAMKQLVETRFNMKYVALLSLGAYRQFVAADELNAYEALFTDFMVGKYAGLLNAYDGEEMFLSGAASAGQRDAVVITQFERAGRPPIEAEWRVRLFAGVPKIIDVKIEGLSLAQSQREEFGTVIDRAGFAGLMQMLKTSAETGDRA